MGDPGCDRARTLATVAAVPWAVWAALRVTGTERGFPLVPALAFTPHAALTSLAPLGLAAAARSPAGLLLSAGAGAVLGATVAARHRAARSGPAPQGERLRVATVSLRLGLVPAQPVLDLVRRYDVDVLAVAELTPVAEARLRAAGIDRLLPGSHVVSARPGSVPSASGALWTRRPVVARAVVPGGFEQPTVRLGRAAGPDVEVTAVHSAPPATSPSAVRRWQEDLALLPDPADDVLRVLAGDFNATLDHAALRAVLRRGWTDAASAVGRAAAWTWRPLRLPAPRLGLDHVLVDRRIGVASTQFVPVRGSDHRAVVADLVLPGG